MVSAGSETGFAAAAAGDAATKFWRSIAKPDPAIQMQVDVNQCISKDRSMRAYAAQSRGLSKLMLKLGNIWAVLAPRPSPSPPPGGVIPLRY